MKKRISFVLSVADPAEHPLVSARRALDAGEWLNYTLTTATRSETYSDQIHVTITSIFDVNPEEMRGPHVEREFYDSVLRNTFKDSPKVRYVCVESVQLVFGRTNLAKEISAHLDARTLKKAAL